MITKLTNGVATVLAILLFISCGKGTSLSGGNKNKKQSADAQRNNSSSDDGDDDGHDDGEVNEVPNEGTVDNSGQTDSGPSAPVLDLGKIGYIIGFKDNDSIVATYAALTGVTRAEVLASMDANATAAAAKFDDLFGQLPGGEEPSLQTGTAQSAKVKLAGHYCDALGKVADARRAAIYPNVNFAGTLAALDTRMVAQVVINAFWPANLKTVPEMSKTITDFAAALDQVRTGLTGPLATVENLMLAGCVGALGSAQVHLLR